MTLFVLCAGDQPVVPKKKITESAAEPDHVEIYLSTRTIDLYLSAVVDFCQCELRERAVHFHDTLMFQTRTHRYCDYCSLATHLMVICEKIQVKLSIFV